MYEVQKVHTGTKRPEIRRLKKMQQFKFTVKSKVGIYARPALLLSEKAEEFPCRIWIEYKGKKQKLFSSLFAVRRPRWRTISFHALFGTKIRHTISGDSSCSYGYRCIGTEIAPVSEGISLWDK